MEWIFNENETDRLNVLSNLDNKLLIDRICYSLNIDEKELYNHITKDELELLLSSILSNRGIKTKEQINSLVNDIGSSITSPYGLVNAKKAADIITEYCNNKNAVIYIFADYDCDGVLSGYVLTSALREVAKCPIILKYPNRSEGYGLSMEWCEMIIEENINNHSNVLVITVDNGISKRKEVARLKESGIEVIITDHHVAKEEEIPQDCIIVDPHNSLIEQDDTYKHLCGCGVAFKVAEIVQHNFGKDNMLHYTPYLTIATLADVMPLKNENVALIQYGLEIINSDNCPIGIKALKDLKDIDVITANDILWTIAPMINACGRMGDSELASKLFFLDEICTPNEIVIKIDQVNEERKKITKKAIAKISKMNFDENKVCIIPTEEYPAGILGIIAGKVSESFNKPAIVVYNKNGECHGSIRSANGINMLALLKDLKEKGLIETYGGHEEACVCGFNIDKLDEIQNNLDASITPDLYRTQTTGNEKLVIDEVITPSHFNKVVHTIVNLLPCDNRTYSNPTFALTNVKIKSHNRFKSGYTELALKQDNQIFETSLYSSIANKFYDEILPNLNEECEIHIAGTIDKKSFMSSKFQKKVYTLNVVDIKIA